MSKPHGREYTLRVDVTAPVHAMAAAWTRIAGWDGDYAATPPEHRELLEGQLVAMLPPAMPHLITAVLEAAETIGWTRPPLRARDGNPGTETGEHEPWCYTLHPASATCEESQPTRE